MAFQYSVGFKFEFLYAVEKSVILNWRDDPQNNPIRKGWASATEEKQDERDAFEYLADNLRDRGLQVKVLETSLSPNHHKYWTVGMSAGVNMVDWTEWTRLQNVFGGKTDRCIILAVQMVSRVMDFADAKTALALEAAMSYLRETSKSFAWTNKTCNLYIDVGLIGKDLTERRIWKLGTVQNLLTLWVLFQDPLESIHPFHRRTTNRDFTQASSLLSRSIPTTRDNLDWLREVEMTQSFREVLECIGPNAETRKINFAELPWFPDYLGSKPTIEFREHCGTLDVEDVLRWMDLVVASCRFATALEEHGLRFCAQGTLRFEDLVNLLDLPEGSGTQRHFESRIAQYAKVQDRVRDLRPSSESSDSE
ncbi:MAG: hypothetical protein M1817_000296 [Caeruleum heppii]|nr:MAG: hypothetical protein M1817_000296 [Caeruleum heppii]